MSTTWQMELVADAEVTPFGVKMDLVRKLAESKVDVPVGDVVQIIDGDRETMGRWADYLKETHR